MSRLTDSPWVWARNEGAIASISGEHVLPLTALPDGMVAAATNVDLDERGICIPRKGVTAFSTSGSEPTSAIQYLFSYRNGSTDELFAFTGSTMNYWNGSTWATVTLDDTSGFGRDVMAVHYNGKVFLAYDSSVNRLHVLQGGVTRRVGVGAVSKPTIADTGAGAYTATLRYYKVQQAVLSGSVVMASSELSNAESFTPSGAGTHARVTKPTTVDDATHWRVFGSADGVTFYALNSYTAVGTTTFDDNVAPASYNTITGIVAPTAGLFVPPPSARFLVSDGVRLLMAGSHETTASTGETTPSTKRVWFTRPLGVTNAGDDEAITQTADARYYIDIDDPHNTTITGLAAIAGMVYVFFDRATWRLVPLGIDGTPYRAEQVSGAVGAISQQAICVGSTPDGTDDAVYFVSQTSGLHRISPARGLEWLGRDVLSRTLPSTITNVSLVFDPVGRDLWIFCMYGGVLQAPRAIAIPFLRPRGAEYHGGAREMSFFNGTYSTAVRFGANIVFGGETGLAAAVLDTYTGTTDNGTAIAATVYGPVLRQPLSMLAAEEPVIQTVGGTATITVGYGNRFTATSDVRTADVAVPARVDGYAARVTGLVIADAQAVQPSITHSAGQTTIVESLAVPYTVREAL